MTMTKNAVGNLITRYKSVLQNCSLLNTFGTLALAGAMVLGGVTGAMAGDPKDFYIGKGSVTYNKSAFAINNTEVQVIGGWLSIISSDNENGVDITSKTFTINSSASDNTTVNVNTSLGLDEIIGGNYAKSSNNINSNVGNTNVTMTSGTIFYLTGGSKSNNTNGDFKTGNTNVTIGSIGSEGPTISTMLVGGSYAKGAGSTTGGSGGKATTSTANTNVTINSGNFTGAAVCVVGGSGAEQYSPNVSQNVTDNTTDASTSLTINSGNFTGTVVGAGYAKNAASSGSSHTVIVSSTVTGAATTVINGGTFNGEVFSGGYAYGKDAKASVGSTSMTINGGTFEGDIYAGGYASTGTGATATVKGDASLTVNGGTFNNVVLNGSNGTVDGTSTLNLNMTGTFTGIQGFDVVNISAGSAITLTANSTFGEGSTLQLGKDASISGGTINVANGAKLDLSKTAGTVEIAGVSFDSTPSAWGWKGASTTVDTYDKDTLEISSVATVTSLTHTSNTYKVVLGAADSATISKALGSGTDSGAVELVANSMNNAAANPTAAKFIVEAAKQGNAGAIIDDATKIASKGAVLPGLANVNTAAMTNMGTRTSMVPQGKVTAASETSTWLAMNGDGAILPTADGSNMAQGFGIWFMPMYNQTSADGFSSGANDYGYDTNIVGATLGADYTFASDLRLGLAFNVGSGSSSSTGGATSTDNDFDFFGFSAYGAKHFDQFGLSFDMGYTVSENEMVQDHSGGDLYGNVDAALFTVGLKGEYQIPFDSFNVTPYAGLRFNYYDVDAYDTKQAGTSLFSTASSDSTVWEIPVGVTFDTTSKVGSWDMTPSLGLGVKFAMGDLDAEQEVSISGVAGSSVLSSEVADDVTFQGALGLGFAKDNCTIGFNYNLDLSENVESHGLSINLRYDF